MLTLVRTPRDIFYLPQRLLVPLFQRPYVWSEEAQWMPLWIDISRLSERRMSGETTATHFLGAVVLQQQAVETGNLAVRTIIDGQQRLTTLQLLLSAVHAEVSMRGFEALAHQVLDLVENPEHFRSDHEDRFKVWPTNRDRPAFNEVMSARPPIDHAALNHSASRMARAHDFFSSMISEWLGDEANQDRARTLVEVVSNQLEIVTIDLLFDENAQEIFETLNARGTPLTPADLIKNYVFQQLDSTPEKTEAAYSNYWSHFETPFWEKEFTSGRVTHTRSSLFLNQWLVAKTLSDVPAREVFRQFKRYVEDRDQPVDRLLPTIKESAVLYKNLLDKAASKTSALSRLEMFTYRTESLNPEIVKPLVLWLVDPELEAVPEQLLDKAVASVESWLVRRAILRANTRSYSRFIVDLLQFVQTYPRAVVGDAVESFLRKQDSPSTYWPGDSEIHRELRALPIYRRLRRARLRMILEAVEDHKRGWAGGSRLHEQPVMRNALSIEHIMPQEWRVNWHGVTDEAAAARREDYVQTLGNLTLVTKSLNSKLSNAPWIGTPGKRDALSRHTSLLMTREVVDSSPDVWDEPRIIKRTESLTADLLKVWPVPAGHSGMTTGSIERASYRVEVADLVNAGFVNPGQTLYARPRVHSAATCQISEDGRLYLGDVAYGTLSGVAKAVTGSQSEAGWNFWLIERAGDRSMSTLREEYLDGLDEELETSSEESEAEDEDET